MRMLYSGKSYYRLRQTDFDGKITYSHPVAFHFEKSYKFNIYPNPFNSSTRITLNDETLIGNCVLIIYSVLGEEVRKIELTNKLTTIESNDFSTGVHYYKVIENKLTTQSGKLMIKH